MKLKPEKYFISLTNRSKYLDTVDQNNICNKETTGDS